MQIRVVAKLPSFDTGQLKSAIFDTGDAMLTVRFSELPAYQLRFQRLRWHQFTELGNCTVAMIRDNSATLVEIVNSPGAAAYAIGDLASQDEARKLLHFRIYLDDFGCHEFYAYGASGGYEIDALDLGDTAAWAKLTHAYGSAIETPALLRGLLCLPRSNGTDEPWFTLWSSLAHQGDVYSASFAAVPHVVRALALDPSLGDFSYVQFPAWVEICRKKNGIDVPGALHAAYFAALARLPSLVTAAQHEWDDDFLCVALAAIAAVRGSQKVAEAALELTPKVADEFLTWFFEYRS